MIRGALALAWALAACHPAPTRTDASASTPPRAPAPLRTLEHDGPDALEQPQPVAVRINREYQTRDDPKRWSASFEREGREAFDRRAEIIAALELRPGMAVADIGAGSGLFTIAIAEKVGARGLVYAVDPQPYFREHIAARAREAELGNVRTVAADQRQSGLASASIDLAFLCDAYHHLELPRTYLADLHAALREGGRLVVIDYDRTRPDTDRWMRDHVRADPEVFRAEIEAAGFVLRAAAAPTVPLRENFLMIFERR